MTPTSLGEAWCCAGPNWDVDIIVIQYVCVDTFGFVCDFSFES